MSVLLAILLLAQASPTKVKICDQTDPTKCASVDSTGALKSSATLLGGGTTCHATALGPTYVEGTDDPISCDLSGVLRTSAGGGGGGGSVTQGTTPWAVSLMNSGTTGVVMLNAVNATGASAAYSNTNGYTAHVLHVVATGTPNIVIRLEGSYDNSNWNTLSTVTQASASLNDLVASGWYPYLRANLSTFSGGSSPTLTAVYHGIEASIASTQLPAALDANGNLKVHEQQTNPQLPTNLSAGVNLRTTLQDWGSGGSAGGGSFTSASALDSSGVVTSSSIAYATVLVSVNVSGSITSGSFNMECSNDAGTTYFACSGARASSGATDTVIALSGVTKELWRVPFAGLSAFRIRLNPVITGAGTATTAIALSAVPYDAVVSVASLPLPAGASTEATLALIKAKTDNLDVALSTRTKPADTQAVSAASLPLPSGAATDRTTAAAPFSTELSDGAAFYTAAKTGQFPAALDGSGFFKTHEQGTATVSGTVGATQSGTWTVQPGNTANTTAWKVDGSAVTQPISGTVAATESGTWTVQPGNTANTTAWKVDGSAVTQPISGTVAATESGTWNVGVVPITSGGLSIKRTLAAASTNSTNAKASTGQVYGWYITNISVTAKFVKLYDSASAPTCGSGTPVITLLIPAQGTASLGAGATSTFTAGLAFASGIGYCITGAVADADTTAVAANDVIVNLFYK